MKNRPLQVGITGGIGSGKSLVSRIFQVLGVPVYDADSRARNLMTTDKSLIEQIIAEFGPLSYLQNGSLNRTHISKLTFGNPEKLRILNNLVHPCVAKNYAHWVTENSNFQYVLREAALLYESGSYTTVDKMIVVAAPASLRIKRVISRDPHRTQEDIGKIMKSQWPEEEKIKRADFVILNDDQHMVIPQVLALHDQFSNLNG